MPELRQRAGQTGTSAKIVPLWLDCAALADLAAGMTYRSDVPDPFRPFRRIAAQTIDAVRRETDGSILPSVAAAFPDDRARLAFLECLGDAIA